MSCSKLLISTFIDMHMHMHMHLRKGNKKYK